MALTLPRGRAGRVLPGDDPSPPDGGDGSSCVGSSCQAFAADRCAEPMWRTVAAGQTSSGRSSGCRTGAGFGSHCRVVRTYA